MNQLTEKPQENRQFVRYTPRFRKIKAHCAHAQRAKIALCYQLTQCKSFTHSATAIASRNEDLMQVKVSTATCSIAVKPVFSMAVSFISTGELLNYV